MLLPPIVDKVLQDLEEFGQANDAAISERAGKMLNLERDTAALLYLLVRSAGCRRVLEIGTSNGVSTLWLAAALQGCPDAQALLTIERDAAKSAQAAGNLDRAGLADGVSLLVGDATATVATLPGPFDCVFFDADRVSAPEQLALLLPKLAPDCLLLADNALSHAAELAAYVAAVEALPGFVCSTIPVGKGLHVAHRRRGG